MNRDLNCQLEKIKSLVEARRGANVEPWGGQVMSWMFGLVNVTASVITTSRGFRVEGSSAPVRTGNYGWHEKLQGTNSSDIPVTAWITADWADKGVAYRVTCKVVGKREETVVKGTITYDDRPGLLISKVAQYFNNL